MPVLDTTNWGTNEHDASAPATVGKKQHTGVLDGLKATWEQEGIYNSSLVRPTLEYADDSSFDYKTTPREFWNVTAFARNQDHADDLIKQATKERENKAIMDNQHWAVGIMNNVLVGATNPLNYIGFGGASTIGRAVVKGAAGAALGTALSEPILHNNQLERTLGDSLSNIAGAAAFGGVIGGAGKAVANKFKHGSFTVNEPAHLPPSVLTPTAEASGITPQAFGAADSIGAARATTRDLADSSIARMPEWMTRFAIGGDYTRSANQRLGTSSFAEVRNAANVLVRQNLATAENLAGKANDVPIEVAVGQRFGDSATKLMETDTNLRAAWWSKVDSGVYDKDEILSQLRAADPRLPDNYSITEASFDKVLKAYMADDQAAIAKQMTEIHDRVRAGADIRESLDADKIDLGLAKKHQLVDIATGERVYKPDESPAALKLSALRTEREQLLEAMNEAKAGKASKDVLDGYKSKLKQHDEQIQIARDAATAYKEKYDTLVPTSKTHRFANEDSSHYLSRVFDKGRIMRDREGFTDSLIAGWLDRNPDLGINDAETMYALRHAAGDVINKILNEDQTVSLGDLNRNLDLPGKYTKDRTLNIHDRFLQNWTHDNVLGTELYHLSQAAADVEMAKNGLKFEDLMNSIDREFQAKSAEINTQYGAGSEKAAKEINKLADELRQDKVELEYVMRRLKRQNPSVDGAMGSLQQWWGRADKVAGMAQLGSSALPNSLGDLASIARNFGTSNFLKTAFKGIFDADFRKDIKANAKQLGVMSDFVNKTATQLNVDELLSQSLDPNKGFKSVGLQRLDTGLERVNDVFAKVSLIEPWAKIGRVVASAASTQHIAEAAQKGWKNLSSTTRMDLAKFYIDEPMLERIGKQMSKYSDDVDGFKFAGIEKWDDLEAQRVFKASVFAQTEHALNVPSIGSGSQFMTETFAGRVFMRFKAFNNASHESTFLASLQNREASRVVTGTLNYAFWSMLGLVAYDAATGREVSMDKYFGSAKNAEKTAWKLLARSGYVAAPQDWATTGAKALASKNNPLHDEWRKVIPEGLEDEIFSKYKDVSAIEKALGPTYGYGSKAVQAIAGVADGDVSAKDVGNIRQSLPGQNIGWLRRGLDYVEEYLGGRKADRNAKD